MKLNPQIFREYDIRGIVDEDLTPEFAYLLGRAYASLAHDHNLNNIVVGHDCRLSSPKYATELARGINEEGLDCLFIGMGPTPQVYYTIFAKSLGGGIQVTGSHNPPNMNGFKICLGTKTLTGAEIQDLRTRMESAQTRPASAQTGKLVTVNNQQEYIDALIENCRPFMGKRKLKVVLDAGNGVGGLTGPAVLRGLGVEVIELYCEPDGRFPNHHPDPTVMKNIEELISVVKREGADLGIGLDGDADRIGVVDENGKVIFGDMLLLIYARHILKEKPGATIIGDVKCSDLLFSDLKERGANPIMWKTGHSLIKNKLKESGGQLGGEMSAHIFFKHRFYGFDDAVYAAARLCEIASNSTDPISAELADLPKRISTPEIRVDCPEEIKFKIVEIASKSFSEYPTITIDGVRINFEHGWGLVRASNTQPVLVMRFEADTESNLEKYQQLVVDKIEQIKSKL